MSITQKQRACIYARFSSSKQREESIEGQLRECRAFAERNNLLIVEEYTDSAISGRTDDRPAFQKMIADSETGLFKIVLVYTLDRFARSRKYSIQYKDTLKQNGVRLISVTQPIIEGPEGIIMESLIDAMSEYYSDNLSRNVRRGLKENALSCKSNGNLAYGYMSDPEGNIILDPDRAPVVKLMFDLIDQGYTRTGVIEELKKRGVKSRSGKDFKVTSLTNILTNERFTGKYIYDGHVVEGAIPAIIDQDLFDRVQVALKTRKRRSKAEREEGYVLSGKLFCGHCGSQMTADNGTGKSGRAYRYYKCYGKKKHNGCRKLSVRKDAIETAVLKIIREDILTDERIDVIAEKISETAKADMESKSMLHIYQRELDQVVEKLKNLTNALMAGIWNDSTKAAMDSLEERKRDLIDLIAIEQTKSQCVNPDQVKAYLYHIKACGIGGKADQALIQGCVERIELFDDLDSGGQKVKIFLKTEKTLEFHTLLSSDSEQFGSPFCLNPNITICNGFIIWCSVIHI